MLRAWAARDSGFIDPVENSIGRRGGQGGPAAIRRAGNASRRGRVPAQCKRAGADFGYAEA